MYSGSESVKQFQSTILSRSAATTLMNLLDRFKSAVPIHDPFSISRDLFTTNASA